VSGQVNVYTLVTRAERRHLNGGAKGGHAGSHLPEVIHKPEVFHQPTSFEGATRRAPLGQPDDRAVALVLSSSGRRTCDLVHSQQGHL
jgi:hypothetical protein